MNQEHFEIKVKSRKNQYRQKIKKDTDITKVYTTHNLLCS